MERKDPFGLIASYEQSFGKGSWEELEKGVLSRLKDRDQFLYNLIKEKPHD